MAKKLSRKKAIKPQSGPPSDGGYNVVGTAGGKPIKARCFPLDSAGGLKKIRPAPDDSPTRRALKRAARAMFIDMANTKDYLIRSGFNNLDSWRRLNPAIRRVPDSIGDLRREIRIALELRRFALRPLRTWGQVLDALRLLAAAAPPEQGTPQAAADPPAPPATDPGAKSKKKSKARKRKPDKKNAQKGDKVTRALGVLTQHSTWSMSAIAGKVGCAKSTLSGSPRFQRLWIEGKRARMQK